MDVDLDDAGIGRDLDDVDARIVRRRIAFEVHRRFGGAGGFLDGGDERGVVLGVVQRRQEHAEVAVARLDRQAVRTEPQISLTPDGGSGGRLAVSRSDGAGGAPRVAAAAARRRTDRAAGHADSRSSGVTTGSEPSGRRKPAGESPGIRKSFSRRSAHRSVTQRRPRSCVLPDLDRQHVARRLSLGRGRRRARGARARRGPRACSLPA